jgi:hypothetical protein
MYVIEGFRPEARLGKTAKKVYAFYTHSLEEAMERANRIFKVYGIVVAITAERSTVEPRWVEVKKGTAHEVAHELKKMGYLMADPQETFPTYDPGRVYTNAHGRDVVAIARAVARKS